MSSAFVMIALVEATLVRRRPLSRFCNPDLIARPFSEILTLIVSRVSVVKS